jgi:hypothetical protein
VSEAKSLLKSPTNDGRALLIIIFGLRIREFYL